MEEIIAFDHKLFLSLNGMGSIPFDAFWMFMTNKAVNVSVYLVVLTYFLKKTPTTIRLLREELVMPRLLK